MSSFTTDQLTALEAAMAQGARRVKYADKEIEYTSLEEMMKLRDKMRTELGVTSGARGARIYMTTSKGLDK